MPTAVETLLLACPLGLMIACAAAEHRRLVRRRAALNRALHELRRPLQVMALAAARRPAPRPPGASARIATAPGPERRPAASAQLELALAALADLDAEINNRRRRARRRRLRAGELVGAAVERWREAARLMGRGIEVGGGAPPAEVVGDELTLARALDNVIANALEHGSGTVRIEARSERARLRIAISDRGPRTPSSDAAGGAAMASSARPPALGGRGHGLEIAAGIAAAHGGRLDLLRGEEGSRAVLELPLAAAAAAPRGRPNAVG